MYKVISELANHHLSEIKEKEDFLTLVEVLDATEEIENTLQASRFKADYEAIINSFKKQRTKIASSYYLYIFSQKNSFFVKQCDKFLQLAIEELNKTNSLLYKLPDELLLYIFTFLDERDIEEIKLTCKKFNIISKDVVLNHKPLNLKAPVNTYLAFPKNSSVTSLIFIKENKIAVSFASGKIMIANVNLPSIEAEFQAHNGSITSLSFDKKNNRLISSGENAKINIWDLETLTCIKTLFSKSAIASIAHYNDTILAMTNNGQIEIWDLTTDTCRLIEAHTPMGRSWSAKVLNYPGTGTFLSYSFDEMKIWDKTTLACQRSYKGKYNIASVTMLPDSSLFIQDIFCESLIRLSKTLKKLNEFKVGKEIADIKVHNNGNLLIMFQSGTLEEYDINNFQLISSRRVFTRQKYQGIHVVTSYKNGTIVLATDDKLVRSQYPALKNDTEKNNQEIIFRILDELNLIFSEYFKCNTGWQFSSENNFFWIRANKATLGNLRKELSGTELSDKYEIKPSLLSDNKSLQIKIDKTFTLEHFANILGKTWKEKLNPPRDDLMHIASTKNS